jgi:hypothetical protein
MLQFTIQDYTTGNPTSTVIDEPVGLDRVVLHIQRDPEYHGFADMVDDSLGKLQFYGQAFTILQNAYQGFGVDAHLECLIEFACDDDGTYQTLYQGRFSMDSYTQMEGLDGCYAECVIQNNYNLTVFRNRMTQKVSLDSLATFDEYESDGVTPYPPLVPYEGLGTQAALQPMTIRMVNYATIDTNPTGSQLYGLSWSPDINSYPYNLAYPCFAGPPSSYGGTDGGEGNPTGNEFNLYDQFNTCINPYTNIRSQELGDFPGPVGDQFNGVFVSASSSSSGNIGNGNPIFTFTPDIPYENTNINIDIELSMAIFNGDQAWMIAGGTNTLIAPTVDIYLLKGINWNDAQTHTGIRYDLSKNNGSGLQGGNRFYNVSGCLIDQKEISGYSNIVSDITPSTSGGYVGSQVIQYSLHLGGGAGTVDGKGIIMHPGEQLFFYVQIQSHGSSSVTQNPQTVFFSGTYTYRNSYYDGTTPYTLTQSVSSDIGLTMGASGSGSTIPVNGGQQLSYFRITFDSQYQATPAPVYMVNEALSRTAEIISNNEFQVYSDYFGRSSSNPIPSLPQASATDGPAGMTSITNGLLIRGYSPLQSYYMGVGQNSIESITSSTYTINLADITSGSNNFIISVSYSAGAIITIPADPPTFYAIGTEIIIEQSVAGSPVTVQGAAGVSISSPSGSYQTAGIGSQILLTNIGLNQWLIGARASMFSSFKDIVDAMKSINAVGFGIENDPNRAGYERIRVEPISWFYQGNTASPMLTCSNVDNVKTTADPSQSIAEFEVGYSKWEAEEAQGLDEFLTKRLYRTTLNVLRTKLSQLCKFVASGYAIETTRRKLGTTTTDWRYDKDLFVICLTAGASPYTTNFNLGLYTNKGPQPAKYSSENGGFQVDSTYKPTGMIDPGSVYNARISPVRNALRWLKYIFQCYIDPASGTLTFMEGEGNYYATGLLAAGPIENTTVSESQTLTLSNVAGDPTTIWKNETVEFKYPLGYNQWLDIYNTKYGLIAYTVNGGNVRYGYLMELKYDLFEGMGDFKLKTAVV